MAHARGVGGVGHQFFEGHCFRVGPIAKFVAHESLKVRQPTISHNSERVFCYDVRAFRAFRLHAEPQTRLYSD